MTMKKQLTDEHMAEVITAIAQISSGNEEKVNKVLLKQSGTTGHVLKKSDVLKSYYKIAESKYLELSEDEKSLFLSNIRMKKIRTLSGVTPLTVLTKPFPCPGKCIFCPNDVRMPKSYISSEPGAQRAETNKFDPYLQTYNRLVAFKNTGHPTEKVELIILGGTWSSYPEGYQIWFVKRCFDAMNDFVVTGAQKLTEYIESETYAMPFDESKLASINGAVMQKTYNQVISGATKSILKKNASAEISNWTELFESHKTNEGAVTRCVGLVIETRPDEINEEELIRLRRLGATKIQIGIQSLDDAVLRMNKRGHDSKITKQALNLIRQAGFKIHVHWMPNLYGSTPKNDISDYKKLFLDSNIKPDEIKIYPCSLIESAELMKYFKNGKWKPYTETDLIKIISECYKNTPRYCRITRVVRDIPSTDIVAGNKKTNLRQMVEQNMYEAGTKSLDIRAREIRSDKVTEKPILKITSYDTAVSQEYFIEFVTGQDKILGFLRLSLPKKETFIKELAGNSVIREVHVYGKSIELGVSGAEKIQHSGLGKKLIHHAEKIAKESGYNIISVISSVGTRKYYEKNGFKTGKLYQHKTL